MADRGCAWLREVDAELALGLLDAEDRGAALAHLDHCPECRIRVTQYAQVGDGLLGLLPGVEPPVGFEDRVMARLTGAAPTVATATADVPLPAPAPVADSVPVADPGSPDDVVVPLRSRTRRRRWMPITVAAALAAVVCGLGGWALGATATPTAPPAAASTDLEHGTLLTAAQHADGEIWVYTGKRPWLYMYVTNVHAGRVSCELTRRDGGVVDSGSFPLANGAGYWGVPLDVDPKQITGVRVVDDQGAVLANATFR